jgi:ABC-type dipeptide/oligopeptide/nickel transport system permease subunit
MTVTLMLKSSDIQCVTRRRGSVDFSTVPTAILVCARCSSGSHRGLMNQMLSIIISTVPITPRLMVGLSLTARRGSFILQARNNGSSPDAGSLS